MNSKLEDWSYETKGHEVSAHQIMRVQDAIGDTNPIFSDAEVARAHGYRAAVAPPTMVDSFNPFYAGAPFPVDKNYPYEFSGGDSFVFHEPVCVGDILDTSTRVVSFEDRTRSDGKNRILVVNYEKNYVNRETSRTVATVVWSYVNFEGSPTASSPTPFQDPVGAGEEIPKIVDTLDNVKIVKWSGAMGDWALVHIDYPLMTKERGLKDVVGHGPRTTALLVRALTDWLGADGRPTSVDVRYRGNTYPGDTMTTRVWTTSDGEATMAVVNQDGVAVTTGTATFERGA